MYASPEMERVVFRKIVILFGEFKKTIGTSDEKDTTKLFIIDPQLFKKLQSLTSRE
jgi:hypothetical protein